MNTGEIIEVVKKKECDENYQSNPHLKNYAGLNAKYFLPVFPSS